MLEVSFLHGNWSGFIGFPRGAKVGLAHNQWYVSMVKNIYENLLSGFYFLES
jgi:hypothetical protein